MGEGQREREGDRESQAGSTPSHQIMLIHCFFLSLFIYFEGDRVSGGGAEREVGVERGSQAGSTQSTQSDVVLQLMNLQDLDLTQNLESDAQPTQSPRHPHVNPLLKP